jgi:hypothetical protein
LVKVTNRRSCVCYFITLYIISLQIYWEEACLASYTGKSFCRLGTPFPKDLTGVNISDGKDGLKFNCYVNHKIDDYWVKELENGLKDHVPEIAKRLELQ